MAKKPIPPEDVIREDSEPTITVATQEHPEVDSQAGISATFAEPGVGDAWGASADASQDWSLRRFVQMVRV